MARRRILEMVLVVVALAGAAALLVVAFPKQGAGDESVAPTDALGALPSPVLRPAHVTIGNATFVVDDAPMGPLQCVAYAPIPIGSNPSWGYHWARYPENYAMDLEPLHALGANAVKVSVTSGASPEELRAFMSAALDKGIRTILVVEGPNHKDASDPAVRDEFLGRVNRSAASFADHPGLLLWELGNEVDFTYPRSGNVEDWYRLLDEAARTMHRLDPDHPVSTSNNPVTNPRIFANDSPSVDVFGTNIYPLSKQSMQDALAHIATRAPGHPILVAEFGADAYDSSRGAEDEATQAAVVRAQWSGIVAARAAGLPVLGGCAFEWVDQWWKTGKPDVHDPGPDWFPTEKGVLPDNAFSEEWFGFVKNSPSDAAREFRSAYTALAHDWGGSAGT